MAIKPVIQYPGKANAADANYPGGSARNITTPGDGTGTPLEQAWLNDLFGFQQALLSVAGIVQSGAVDTALVSEYCQAVTELAMGRPIRVNITGGSTGDNIIVNALGNLASITPRSYFDGLRVELNSVAANTGAMTLNAFGLGAKSVRVPTGHSVTLPNTIKAGEKVRFIYSAGTDNWFFENLSRPLIPITVAGVTVALNTITPYVYGNVTGSGVLSKSRGITSVIKTAVGKYSVSHDPYVGGEQVIVNTTGLGTQVTYAIPTVTPTQTLLETYNAGVLTDTFFYFMIYNNH